MAKSLATDGFGRSVQVEDVMLYFMKILSIAPFPFLPKATMNERESICARQALSLGISFIIAGPGLNEPLLP